MHGAGNDFIIIDNRFYNFSGDELSEIAKRVCRRRFAIGADGILALSSPDRPENAYRMVYYNADGSRGSMCGNGARCLARFARDAGIDRGELQFESDAGVYRAGVEPDGRHARLYVRSPERYDPHLSLRTPLPQGTTQAHYLWAGVEHVVLFVDRLDESEVGSDGRRLRWDPVLQPAGANINFVAVVSNGENGAAELSVRTFEKGVEAETLACGTGAIASAVVAALTGRLASSPVAVSMPGGKLEVGFRLEGERAIDVYLQGPVESVYRGSFLL